MATGGHTAEASRHGYELLSLSSSNWPSACLPYELVSAILRSEADRIYAADPKDGMQALWVILASMGVTGNEGLRIQAALGNEWLIRQMLSNSPNPDRSLLDSALADACKSGHARVAALLLDHGADPLAWGARALSSAAYRGHMDVIRTLTTHTRAYPARARASALRCAAAGGHADIIHMLLNMEEEEEEDNMEVEHNAGVLEEAAERGHEGVVRALLACEWDCEGTVMMHLHRTQQQQQQQQLKRVRREGQLLQALRAAARHRRARVVRLLVGMEDDEQYVGGEVDELTEIVREYDFDC